jgi:probable F420-dependent oxidoreductase
MKFSFSLFPFHDPGAPDPYRKTFELCRWAEELGFDTAVVPEHHFQPDFMTAPFVYLAAIAARTERLRLATNIFLLPLHHPVEVAEQVAVLDQLSGGRATLGVGSGWSPLEYDAFGVSLRERGTRMDEGLQIVRRAWSEERFSFQGRHFTVPEVTLYPRPVQKPRPPIWVAGVAPPAVERAARLGDALIVDPVVTLPQARDLLDAYRAACARQGATPRFVMRRYTWLGANRRQVEEESLGMFARAQVAYWKTSIERPEERERYARIDTDPNFDPWAIAQDRFLAGTPEDCVREIRRYQSELGCDHLILGFAGGTSGRPQPLRDSGAYYDRLRAVIDLFGREVMPAFTD